MSKIKSKSMTLADAYSAFKEPFEDKAYSVDSTRGFDLTALKAQYVVERLNDVLYGTGAGGWYFTGSYQHTDNGVLYFGQLTVSVGEESILIENVGFKAWPDNGNDGDAYKSAKTDSLSKCASHVGIGNEMYKGNISPNYSTDSFKDVEEEDVIEKEIIEDEELASPPTNTPVKLRASRTFKKSTKAKFSSGSRFNG